MYFNFAKSQQAFPALFRVYPKPKQLYNSKPLSNPSKCFHFTTFNGDIGNFRVKIGSVSNGFRVTSIVRGRCFSSSVGEGNSDGKSLPWLCSSQVKGFRGLEKRVGVGAYGGSKSVKRFEQEGSSTSWEKSATRLENEGAAKSVRSSWEESVEPALESNRHRSRMNGAAKEKEFNYGYNGGTDTVEKEEEAGEEELDVSEDPRWDRIRSRFDGTRNTKGKMQKPEFNRWNKQENWGRKTWREATQSTLPKMVGEGVYGVGPVLAALSSGRREFYALYIQEGLDLTGSNKKKKDKKGFEKVLKMAQKIGLSLKEVSKHDLNMISDNRPHQGLVLDASPLEMVKIMELDPVSNDDKGSLWVALDEVTDPQNLGAIIRSAYFFGASGIVLCAKNSAPLSGVVSKASAGSLEIMELRYCKNMMQFLISSAENGWRVLGGSVAPNAVSLNDVVPGEPTILVLGSEGTGLRPLVERSCTQLVRIPGNIPIDAAMGGNDDLDSEEANAQHSNQEFQSFLAVESLNVSVAAGVLIHHLIRSNHNDIVIAEDK